MSQDLQDKISLLEKDLQAIRIELAVMTAKQEQLIKKLDGFSSGVNRGLWILGGGFISAVVFWVVNGGLGGQ